MSFGFSPSDIVTLITLSTKAWKSWRNACGDYTDITSTLHSLQLTLRRVSQHFPATKAPADQDHVSPEDFARLTQDYKDLRHILRGCTRVVVELQEVVDRHSGMKAIDRQTTWARLKFASKNLQSLRSKVSEHTQQLAIFLQAIELSTIDRLDCVVKDLPNVIADRLPIAIGRLIDSRMADLASARGSALTAYEDDDKQVWKQFRRNMIKAGIRSDAIKDHRSELEAFLSSLITNEPSKQVGAATVSGEGGPRTLRSQRKETVPQAVRAESMDLDTTDEVGVVKLDPSSTEGTHQTKFRARTAFHKEGTDMEASESRNLNISKVQRGIGSSVALSTSAEQTSANTKQRSESSTASTNPDTDESARAHLKDSGPSNPETTLTLSDTDSKDAALGAFDNKTDPSGSQAVMYTKEAQNSRHDVETRSGRSRSIASMESKMDTAEVEKNQDECLRYVLHYVENADESSIECFAGGPGRNKANNKSPNRAEASLESQEEVDVVSTADIGKEYRATKARKRGIEYIQPYVESASESDNGPVPGAFDDNSDDDREWIGPTNMAVATALWVPREPSPGPTIWMCDPAEFESSSEISSTGANDGQSDSWSTMAKSSRRRTRRDRRKARQPAQEMPFTGTAGWPEQMHSVPRDYSPSRPSRANPCSYEREYPPWHNNRFVRHSAASRCPMEGCVLCARHSADQVYAWAPLPEHSNNIASTNPFASRQYGYVPAPVLNLMYRSVPGLQSIHVGSTMPIPTRPYDSHAPVYEAHHDEHPPPPPRPAHAVVAEYKDLPRDFSERRTSSASRIPPTGQMSFRKEATRQPMPDQDRSSYDREPQHKWRPPVLAEPSWSDREPFWSGDEPLEFSDG